MKLINKSIAKKTIAMVLVLLVLCPLIVYGLYGLFGVIFLDSPRSPRDPIEADTFSNSGSYNIDANTILKSIDSGQSPIFLPETVQTSNSNINSTLGWTQAEHLKVAVALFEFEWKESLSKDWSIHKIIFRRNRNCQENLVGFEYSTFVFHRLSQDGSDYNARAISISLPYGIVSWGDGETYPLGGIEFDVNKLKITADDAFSIAEKNGGKAARQSVQNKCRLSFFLDENWRVIYYGPISNNSPKLFEITIDPYTGEIISSR
jgi:hypothetical protein